MRLVGKVAVVTGAASGIGKAMAERFAVEGARVVTVDRDETRVGDLAVQGDVADPAVMQHAVDTAVREFGRLDVLCNNAGYGLPDTVRTMSDELLQELLDVNLFGVLHGTRAALPVMIEQGGGSIINTASTAAFAAADARSAYGVAKAAVVQLTRSTAVEHGVHGIRCNAICPGPIHTPAFERFAGDLDAYLAQLPMRRLGKPEDIAALALFLASDESAYLSGQAITMDGAMSARLFAPEIRR